MFRGSVGSAQCRLDSHKNSDLGSEVSTGTDLNSTTHRLIESMALLTKCYVQAERSTRLEWEGYDQVALPVVNGASASGTR